MVKINFLYFFNNFFFFIKLNFFFMKKKMIKNFLENSLYKKSFITVIKIKNYLSTWITFFVIKKYKYLEIYTKNKFVYNLIKFLKFHYFFSYNYLIDLFGIDFLFKQNKRFNIIYNLYSFKLNSDLFIKFFINEFEYTFSISKIFQSSNWLEREVWDMFGIIFLNHNDLRRILTDYGFLGYPLRKDYALFGYLEYFFDLNSKRVIIIKIKLTQNFRFFFFDIKWVKLKSIYISN